MSYPVGKTTPGSRVQEEHRTLASGHGKVGSKCLGEGAWWRNESSFSVLEQPRCGREGATLTAQLHLGKTPQWSYLQAKVLS